MNGLRKVVKLRVYDVPNDKVKLNKDKTYYYNWKNRYFIGNFELHKSKQFNNHTEKKKSRLAERFKGSILGTDIGVKSSGFSTVAILATVIALAVVIGMYFLWRF